jgi:hypothetical protein
VTDLAGNDTFFTNIDGSITRTQWESLIDQAIDKVNAHGAPYGIDIPNMSGTAGAKTWSGTSAEAGWIRTITARIYNTEYKTVGSSGVGSLSETVADRETENLAEQAAVALRDLDITVGADASF